MTKTQVPVTTIDDSVRENRLNHVDLVKIDVESAEAQVLRGMMQTLRRDHPNIICEVLRGYGTESSLDEILRPLSYRYYLLNPDAPTPRDQIEGDTNYLNYLFTTLDTSELASHVKDTHAVNR